ncbi:MAG: radical SAM protein [Elusimicrobia bacterium]|nr:radical SAM protein [Elusimicrobiota bacterium]
MKEAAGKTAYRYKDALYLNITNRCPTLCVFCIKNSWKMDFRGYDLNLKNAEPQTPDVLKSIIAECNAAGTGRHCPQSAPRAMRAAGFKELVFCGYGEPLMRLPQVIEICKSIRDAKADGVPAVKIRVNTNGLGNLVWKRDIAPELKNLVDSVHVSLNTADPEQWKKIMKPLKEYEKEGFESAVEFIKSSKKLLRETVITAVEMPDIDLKKVQKFSEELGVKLRLRPLL